MKRSSCRDYNLSISKRVLQSLTLCTLLLMALPMTSWAQSFTYNYRGVDFKCKVKKGMTYILSFDRYAAKVVIPAQVLDKAGRSHAVNVIDLYLEGNGYTTNMVVIEPGISEIEEYSFFGFSELREVYIPNTIEKIGKNAFKLKQRVTFNMPSNIKESDLMAGNVVYPLMQQQQEDTFAGIDLSAYGQDSPNASSESSSSSSLAAVTVEAITPGTSDIDYNIPSTNARRENTFCLIIANEEYKQKDTPNVKYAAQDGKTFQNYCLRTLGLPKENIRFASNASYLQMKSLLGWFQQIADVYGQDANFIVYYAGHGVPDEGGNCKLIPSDVSINDVNNGFSLKELYDSLGKLTTKSTLVLIDACFSGNDREDVAAVDENHRGIARKVKDELVTGNVVVLTAASGTETALSYDEKAHGLFSYYLMKKLQETKGNVTYGELYDYARKEVMRKSIVAKGKKQTPSAIFSSQISNTWKQMKF